MEWELDNGKQNRTSPLIKFCGLTRQADADAARDLGADFCGFIFHPKSPRHVTPERAAAIATGSLARVGVFVDQDLPDILGIMRAARLDFAQLHGRRDNGFVKALRGQAICVFWPQKYTDLRLMVEEMEEIAPSGAWFLLDAGHAGGGHGRALDFNRLAGLSIPGRWFMAGGLNAENIPAALAACHPDGLDINSGVEDAPGLKNHARMQAAMRAAKGMKE